MAANSDSTAYLSQEKQDLVKSAVIDEMNYTKKDRLDTLKVPINIAGYITSANKYIEDNRLEEWNKIMISLLNPTDIALNTYKGYIKEGLTTYFRELNPTRDETAAVSSAEKDTNMILSLIANKLIGKVGIIWNRSLKHSATLKQNSKRRLVPFHLKHDVVDLYINLETAIEKEFSQWKRVNDKYTNGVDTLTNDELIERVKNDNNQLASAANNKVDDLIPITIIGYETQRENIKTLLTDNLYKEIFDKHNFLVSDRNIAPTHLYQQGVQVEVAGKNAAFNPVSFVPNKLSAFHATATIDFDGSSRTYQLNVPEATFQLVPSQGGTRHKKARRMKQTKRKSRR